MVNNLTMLAYYHMKIPISLCQLDRIFYKEWLPFFTWTISSKSLFVQLLHFKWEFLTGRKLKDRQYNGQKKKDNKTNKSERLLFNANSAIFQLYHCENKLIFNEIRFVLHQHAPLIHIILIPNQPVFALSLYCCVLSGEATITNVIVCGFTQSGLEPMI
jgi:hypothetical protein